MLSAKFLHWIEVQTGGGGLAIYTMVWKKISVIYRDFWFLYKSLKSPLYELHSVLYIIALYVSFLTIVSQVFVSVEPWAELVEEREKKRGGDSKCVGPFGADDS